MRCPVCLSPDSRVLDKRDSADGTTTRRRRKCPRCEHRFTTYERVDLATLMVVKSDGRRQEFSPEKLRHSIQLACTKRPISAEAIQGLVEQIEADVRSRDVAEISSKRVGDLVMDKLRELDKVAYIRFASVYRDFADLSSFEDELRNLITKNGEVVAPPARQGAA